MGELRIKNYDYSYRLAQFGLSAIIANHIAEYFVRLFPDKLFHPNFVTFINLMLAMSLIPLALQGRYEVFGGVVILIIMLDNVDGYLARAWKASSSLGRIFDGFVDCFAYACLIVSTYILEKSILPIVVLAIYTVIVNCRFFLAQMNQPSSKDVDLNQKKKHRLVRSAISFLMGYNDAICALGLIILINKAWISYWLMYEIIRRAWNFLNLSRQFWYSHIHE